jgi:hypothetical protein
MMTLRNNERIVKSQCCVLDSYVIELIKSQRQISKTETCPHQGPEQGTENSEKQAQSKGEK